LRSVLKEKPMKSPIAKRSVVLDHHKTSISLEDEFWNGVRAIADRKNMKLTELLQQIDSERSHSNLSSAIRVFVLNETRAEAGLQPEQEPRPELRGGGLPRSAVEAEPVS
jgi:predicted DNA-binding ribbon-helix-helix protein